MGGQGEAADELFSVASNIDKPAYQCLVSAASKWTYKGDDTQMRQCVEARHYFVGRAHTLFCALAPLWTECPDATAEDATTWLLNRDRIEEASVYFQVDELAFEARALSESHFNKLFGAIIGEHVRAELREVSLTEGLTATEIERKIHDVLERHERHRPSGLPVCTIDDAWDIPADEWRVEKYLPRQGLACFYGAPAEGKTFVTLDIALHVAMGRPWMGREVERTPVLYVVGEKPTGFKKRLRAWCRYYGLDRKELAEWFFFIPEPVLMDGNGVEAIKAACRKLPQKPGLFVVDTLATCYAGDSENDAAQMGDFCRSVGAVMRHIDGGAIVVHHKGKNAREERGSSVLRAACDTMVAVSKLDGSDPVFKAKMDKQSDAEEQTADHFDLKKVPGLPGLEGENSGAVITPTGAMGVTPEATGVGRKLLETLLLRCIGSETLTTTQWRAASGIAETTFYTYRKTLVENELVEIVGKGTRLTDKARELVDPTFTPTTPENSQSTPVGVTQDSSQVLPPDRGGYKPPGGSNCGDGESVDSGEETKKKPETSEKKTKKKPETSEKKAKKKAKTSKKKAKKKAKTSKKKPRK